MGTDYEKLATELKWRDYCSALGQIRDDLGLSPRTSHAEMEALLIFSVNDIYGESLEADITLMALGLLKGFARPQGQPEAKAARILYSNRRDRFIQYTDYTSMTDNDGTPLKTIQGTLNSKSSRYIVSVISKLCNKEPSEQQERPIEVYLDVAKQTIEKIAHENGKKIDWKGWKYIPQNLLPGLTYFKLITSTSPQSEPVPVNDTPTTPSTLSGAIDGLGDDANKTMGTEADLMETRHLPLDKKFRTGAILSKIVSKLQEIKHQTLHIRLLLMIAISNAIIAISVVVIAATLVISLISKDAPPADSPTSISELSPSPIQGLATDGVVDSFSNSNTRDIQN